MVAASFNLLAALTANAAPSPAGNSQADETSTKEAGRHFAKLVSESSDQTRDVSVGKHYFKARRADDSTTRPHRSDDSSPRTTTQRIDDSSGHGKADTRELNRAITPREASKALDALNQQEASGQISTDLDPETLAQVKAKLQAIVDSNKPAPLADVLAAATGKDPKDLLALFANANTQATEEVTALASAVKKVLGFLDKALHLASKKDSSEPKSADETVTGAADVQPNTLTEITPLANTILLAQQPITKVVDSSTTIATAAPVDAISAIDDNSSKRVTIDALIPSLALSQDDKKAELPDVELPKIDTAASANLKEQAQAPAAPTTQAPSNIERQLQALNNSASFLVAGAAVKDESAAKAPVAANANGQVTAIGGVQAVSAAGNITGANAVTAAANVAGNLLNHAPVREQVQVAISKASKEGVEQITIALEPQGLGRVEVKMHTGRDGQTQLSFLIDKPETFDALSRDARGLERSLQEAGLKADSGGMQFNLRQQPQMQSDSGSRQPGQQHSANAGNDTSATAEAATATRTYRIGVQDGIDIHA